MRFGGWSNRARNGLLEFWVFYCDGWVAYMLEIERREEIRHMLSSPGGYLLASYILLSYSLEPFFDKEHLGIMICTLREDVTTSCPW